MKVQRGAFRERKQEKKNEDICFETKSNQQSAFSILKKKNFFLIFSDKKLGYRL